MKMKYIISSNGKDLAFQYDVPKKIATVGGPNSACDLAWDVMMNVFGVPSDNVESKKTSSGKTKYEFSLPMEEVHQGLRSLEVSGIPVQSVNGFGRLVW